MSSDRSLADWFRSALPLLLLRQLADGPNHGYGLIEALRSAGFEVKGATVYPHLSRLQDEGSIESEWHGPESGPARKVMTITPAGTDRLRALEEHWARFRDQIEAALDGPEQGDDRR
ncbi:PadR family transcriptional regulator [Microbacterium lacticum]